MRYFIMILCICLVVSCGNTNNTSNRPQEGNAGSKNVIDFGNFKIVVPTGWKKLEFKGIDSYVGGLTDGNDTLEFDYGMYSNDLMDECETQLYADVTINGKVGYITRPKNKGEGICGVYFKNIDGNRFNLYSVHPKKEDNLISIFRNIIFKTSDTAINSKSLEFKARSCH